MTLLRQLVGARQRLERAAPVLRRDGRVALRQLAQHVDAAPPQPALRQRRVGQQRVDLRAQVAAGLGAEAPRVQAHLVGQAGDAQARQPARHADGIERAEQLERAVLGALGRRDARHRAVAEQHRLGQAAALEHVEPVGQQRGGLVGLVALPQRRGQQRRQHAGERAAPAEVGLGARQRRPQQLLGQQHLAFPQVGQRRR